MAAAEVPLVGKKLSAFPSPLSPASKCCALGGGRAAEGHSYAKEIKGPRSNVGKASLLPAKCTCTFPHPSTRVVLCQEIMKDLATPSSLFLPRCITPFPRETRLESLMKKERRWRLARNGMEAGGGSLAPWPHGRPSN